MNPSGPEPFLPLRANGYVGAGRYLLQQHLGDGGMGSVWAAWDREVGKHYALKFLSHAAAQDPEHWTRLRQEILRAQELRNDHIVGFFDLVIVPGEAPFLKMEYVPGRNLEEKRLEFPDGAMPWDRLSPLIPQLCEALDHAHERGIVHCDIKPSNLMVDGLGQLKLADFGIAQLADSDETGPVFGTKAYMSPQRLTGSQPEPRDDLYSVGATLYELLTGEPPFLGENLTSRIIEEPAEPVHERLRRRGLANEVPIRVAQIVMRCLDKDPAARPQTARELSRILSPAGGAPRSKPKPPPPPLLPAPSAAVARPRIPPTPLKPAAIPGPEIPPATPAPQAPALKLAPDPGPPPEPGPARPPSPFPSPSEPSPGSVTNSTGLRPRPAPEELWPVILKVLALAAFLVAAALAIVFWPRSTTEAGSLVLVASDRRQPEASTEPQFSYWITLDSQTIAQGKATNARPVTVELRPGDYRVEVSLQRNPGASALGDPTLVQTAGVRRGSRLPLAFVFGGSETPDPRPGTLELTVTDLAPPAPDARTLFSYHIDRQGQVLTSGTAIHGDPTTIELAAGEYRIRVAVAPESSPEASSRGATTNALSIASGVKTPLILRFGTAPTPVPAPKDSQPTKAAEATPPVVLPSQPPVEGQPWVRNSPRPGGPPAARFTWLGGPGARLWLASYETTVRDFRAFAAEKPVGRGLHVPGSNGWTLNESLNWEQPGFPQSDDHPVVGVSWLEARAYCTWLTERDHEDQILAPNQRYRLPSAPEFARAAGDLRPSPNAGNLAGREILNSPGWDPAWPPLAGHEDFYPRTAPVGSFRSPDGGPADLIGNAAEWCENWFSTSDNAASLRASSRYFGTTVPGNTFKAVVGGSWFHETLEDADPRVSLRFPPDQRTPFIGFRLLIEDAPESP